MFMQQQKVKTYQSLFFNMQSSVQNITVLVTGTNRGLGKALALQLLEKIPDGKFLFTTRKSPEQSKDQCSQFFTKFEKRNLVMKSLDLSCQKSIENFVHEVQQEKWMFDAIVNNAAMGSDIGVKVPQPKWAKALLYSNVVGTIGMTNLLLPNLKQNGRIVNVSSKLGALTFHPTEVVEEFADPELEEKQIFTEVQEYIARCEEGDLGKRFKSVYGTSKMLLNAWSRFVIRRKMKPGQVSIAMSPGHCVTDMGGKEALNSAESGANAIYECILMPNPSFDIFYHRGGAHQFVNCGPGTVSLTVDNIPNK